MTNAAKTALTNTVNNPMFSALDVFNTVEVPAFIRRDADAYSVALQQIAQAFGVTDLTEISIVVERAIAAANAIRDLSEITGTVMHRNADGREEFPCKEIVRMSRRLITSCRRCDGPAEPHSALCIRCEDKEEQNREDCPW
jgi:hypothetical protein